MPRYVNVRHAVCQVVDVPSNGDRRTRVAIIDDDLALIEVLTEFLHDFEGFDVQTHTQFNGAQEMVLSSEPDVEVLDATLHGEQSGWTIVEALAGDARSTAIPLIVCTGAITAVESRRA